MEEASRTGKSTNRSCAPGESMSRFLVGSCGSVEDAGDEPWVRATSTCTNACMVRANTSPDIRASLLLKADVRPVCCHGNTTVALRQVLL